jgi:hypothetical protein
MACNRSSLPLLPFLNTTQTPCSMVQKNGKNKNENTFISRNSSKYKVKAVKGNYIFSSSKAFTGQCACVPKVIL